MRRKLIDIEDVKIPDSMFGEERSREYLKQVNGERSVTCNGLVVNLMYAGEADLEALVDEMR